MSTHEPENLPPIIKQYVKNLNDTNQKQHIRDNYRMVLSSIVDYCSKAITVYDNAKNAALLRAKRRA